MSIAENIEKVRREIAAAAEKAGRDPAEIRLLAVSKTRSVEEMREAMAAGLCVFGENHVQEIREKYPLLPDASFHMIGHLQTNKVKYIVDKVELIHSVDSLHLAEEIQRQAEKAEREVKILLQVNAAGEASKFGLAAGETEDMLLRVLRDCPRIRVCGLMHIAPASEDMEAIRPYFRQVKELYQTLGRTEHPRCQFQWLSMGMSGDFPLAIEEGANIVRVGSAIFGPRQYAAQ
jgi:pyridoxal phosphate enzyme (YggS family)